MTIPVSSVTSRDAVAVTPHHLATRAALDVIASGGNAVDGAVAANAMLGMVLPTTCGIGGDLFAMVHRPGDDAPAVLNASGRGGSGLDADRIRSQGHETMPLTSPWSITVPGCVDGWEALLERFGTRALGELLAPAISAGEKGFAASPELSAALTRIEQRVSGQPSAPALYPDHRPPKPGHVLRRPHLAAVLRAIGDRGRDAFYTGPVAEAIVAATNGVLTSSDLAANRPDWIEPLGVDLFGLRAWTVPPNSQGYLTLAAARILERLGWSSDPEDPAFHHAVIEAYRAVAWERDDIVADADHAPLPPHELLADERLEARRARLDADAVTSWPAPTADPGGTAYFCVIDADGLMVSFIQSNFHGIGAGISAGDTGVWLHNRGGGFCLVPGHPNEAAPGKRPLHTLSPTLWTRRDGSPALLLGTRGGHQQPQYLLQTIAQLFVAGRSPAAAQAAPRWNMAFEDVGGDSVLSVEARMPEEVVSGLVARRHRVDTGPDLPPGWGPVSIIAIAPDGTRTAAADPRITTAEAAGG
jgi:gamma-glutamyltranspeptidase/glutathione hydrolase